MSTAVYFGNFSPGLTLAAKKMLTEMDTTSKKPVNISDVLDRYMCNHRHCSVYFSLRFIADNKSTKDFRHIHEMDAPIKIV